MSEASPSPFPEERVRLREFTSDDFALVKTVVDDPLIPLTTSLPAGANDAAIRAYINRQIGRATSGDGFQFVIVDSRSGRAVGQIGLTYRGAHRERASPGYRIAPNERRNGYASASLQALSRWAIQERGIKRLEQYVEPWNEGCWRAAESAGFAREGPMKSWERVGGRTPRHVHVRPDRLNGPGASDPDPSVLR